MFGIIKSLGRSRFVSSNLTLPHPISDFRRKGRYVSGYVPVAGNETSLLLYNFFSINYGVRSDLSVLVTLIGDDLNPIASKLFTLKFREIKFLEISANFTSAEVSCANICLVEVIGKDLRLNHGGHEGHLRCFGIWDDFSAWGHTMPFVSSSKILISKFGAGRRFLKDKLKVLAERRFYPSGSYTALHLSPFDKSIVTGRGDLSESLETYSGFSVLLDEENMVKASWHDAIMARDYGLHDNFEGLFHYVSLPNLGVPLQLKIFPREAMSMGSEVRIEVFERYGSAVRKIEQKNFYWDEPEFNLNKFFPNISFGEFDGWLEIIPVSGLHKRFYLNIFYAIGNNRCGDCVHSHPFIKRTGRALKFSPFKFSASHITYLSLFGTDCSHTIRLRFLSMDDLGEIVEYVLLPEKEVLTVNLNQLLESQYQAKDITGIVQVECETANIDATTFICCDHSGNRSVSVDHLTGG